MAEVEMTSMPTALDTAKHAADSVLDKHKANANIAMTINNLSAGTQSGVFQYDTYEYITKDDFDALKALKDAYNTELAVKENQHYRTQLQILMELLSGIKSNHPEFSGGSKRRSKRRSKKRSNMRSKKNRGRRTTSHRRRSRARR
jgi:NADH dehydrogenase/NADH:ubiquinone oxidoreductase subunit G